MKPIAILVLAIAVAAVGICILLAQCPRKDNFAVLATEPTKAKVRRLLAAVNPKKATQPAASRQAVQKTAAAAAASQQAVQKTAAAAAASRQAVQKKLVAAAASQQAVQKTAAAAFAASRQAAQKTAAAAAAKLAKLTDLTKTAATPTQPELCPPIDNFQAFKTADGECKKYMYTCIPGYDLVSHGNSLACEEKCASGSVRDIDPKTGWAIGTCQECVPINNFDYKLNELGKCVGTGKCVAGYEMTTNHGCKATCPSNETRAVDGNCAPTPLNGKCVAGYEMTTRYGCKATCPSNETRAVDGNCAPTPLTRDGCAKGHDLVYYRKATPPTRKCEPECSHGYFRKWDESGGASCILCTNKDNFVYGVSSGQCQSMGRCVDGFEQIRGACVQNCEPGHIRDVSGACVTKCSDGHEALNGSCVPVCADGRIRDKHGTCVFENEGKSCEGNYGIFRDNICVKREPPLKIYCSTGPYKNTLNDKNNCVEDRSICGESYEKVNNECIQKCTDGKFRDKKDHTKCVADGELCNIMSSGRIGRYYAGVCTVTNECKNQNVYAKDINGNDKCADRDETVRVYQDTTGKGEFETMALKTALSWGKPFQFIRYYKDYRV